MFNNKSVTMLSSLPPIIGLSPYTQALVTKLSERIKVSVLGFNRIYPSFIYPGKMRDESLPVSKEHDNLQIRNVLNWYNPIQWVIEAFRIDTDIIHAQWWSFPLAPVYFTILGINRLRKKHIIMTIHNVTPHETNMLKNFLNRSVFWMADEYIVHTNINKEQLKDITKNKPIHVIPHGLLTNPKTKIDRSSARQRLKLKDEDKILLCFGHIREYKGLDTAIKALSLIQDKSVKVLIAGHCWEDWNKYDKIITDLDLKERVIAHLDFIPIQDIEIFFKASDIALLPYNHFDAQSGVGSLILSHGIPFIVSNKGGLPELVDDPACVIEPENAKDLAEKINKILSSPELQNKLKNDCAEKASKLSWDSVADKTVNVYKSDE